MNMPNEPSLDVRERLARGLNLGHAHGKAHILSHKLSLEPLYFFFLSLTTAFFLIYFLTLKNSLECQGLAPV